MPGEGELLGSMKVGSDVLKFRRGPIELPLTIWIDRWRVAYFWRSEMRMRIPNAQYDPAFLKQIIGITPWPGRDIQAEAVAAYRNATPETNIRTCEG